MKKRFLLALAVASVASASSQVRAAPFTDGNLAVFQAETGTLTSNVAGTIVEVLPNTANQTGNATYAIPTTGTNALRFSGSASSTGYLSRSNDRSLLLFSGANTTDTAANTNTSTARGVGGFNSAGNFSLQTTYTGTSGQQPRSATTVNNLNYFISDQAGIYTNGTTAASPAANTRGIKAYDGTVYVLQASATTTIAAVSTVSATTGGSITGLPGIPNLATAQDFYLIASGDNGTTRDVLYIIDDITGTGAGTIRKYSLVGGSWNANGTAPTTFDGFGIAAADSGNGANLFITSGSGGSTNNSLIRVTDAAGYNATINVGTSTTLYTATGGAYLKGVDFVPVNVPEPVNLSILGLGGLTLLRRRRR